MSMELFKSKSDLIREISLLEFRVDVQNHLLKDKENEVTELKTKNEELNKQIEILKNDIKNIKFRNNNTIWR